VQEQLPSELTPRASIVSTSDERLNMGGELSPPSHMLPVGFALEIPCGLLAAFGLVLLSLVWFINTRKLSSASPREKRLPPGPPAGPIIGNMHLIANKGLLHHVLAGLAKEYGPLMTLKLGSQTAVVATSTKMAKEIQKDSEPIFLLPT
jgi:hypothetical protein